MLIECPSCHARSKLSEDHEGAKVRCAECGRIYVARPPGSKGSIARKGANTGLLVGGFVALVAIVVVVFVARSGGGSTPVSQAAPADVTRAPAAAPDYGWKSELVQTVVTIHQSAFAGERDRIKGYLHSERIWEREHTNAEGLRDATVPPFAGLPADQRFSAQDRWAQELCTGESKSLVADWLPYDGNVVDQTDEEALVRVAVRPRAAGIENRWVEWHLAKESGRYKAYQWAQWVSPEEQQAQKRKKGYDVVTLSDGSVVHERKPEPLGHLEDTPSELRTKIDELMVTVLDLELTKESSRAQRALVEIGRPAIPILLTKFYEIPADTDENRVRCNLLDQTLQRITGQAFGYAPGEAGSVAGTSEERRQSSIKQWFAWWYKNQKKFTEKKTSDGLEGLIELSEEEQRWLERNQDK